jgi:steroid delta-isomerase-like uncharacterized protein
MSRASDVVREFFALYRNHEVAKMTGLCSPNGRFVYVPLGEAGRGSIAEVGQRVWSSLIEAFPDLTIVTHSLFDDGADDAAAEVTLSGTQARDFAGIPSKGRHYTLPHGFFFHVEAGRIERIAAYWDNLSFQQQLS